MLDQTFADEIGAISIRDGVVRIDLVHYPPAARDKEGNPAPMFCGRLVMTIPDMLRSYDKMRSVMQQLVDQGLVVRNEGDGPPRKAQPTARTGGQAASSPNFPGKKGE